MSKQEINIFWFGSYLSLETDLALLATLVTAVRNDFSQLHYPAVDFVSAPTLHLIVSCPAAFVPSLEILDKFSQWKLVIQSFKLQS